MAIQDFYEDIDKLIKSGVSDGRGGTKYVLSTEKTLKGLINQATSNEIDMAGKKGIEATHKLYCDITEDLNNDDMLFQDGVYYRITSKPKNTVKRNHHLKIFLKEISLDKENF